MPRDDAKAITSRQNPHNRKCCRSFSGAGNSLPVFQLVTENGGGDIVGAEKRSGSILISSASIGQGGGVRQFTLDEFAIAANLGVQRRKSVDFMFSIQAFFSSRDLRVW